MNAHAAAVALTAFLASAVELVEALTIVLAVGVTRGWGRALGAAALAVVVLAAVVALAGPFLPALVANPWLRLAVGLVALYVGWNWLRKAVLRAAGRKAHRNEDAAFERDRAKAERESPGAAFATAFTGVLIEGVEVVAIVLAIGSDTAGMMGAAAGGALVALLVVAAAGIIVHRPLARVPENLMKYVVGVMVSAFGIYWTGEGLRIAWPGDDAALLYLPLLIVAGALAAQTVLRRQAS